MDGGGGTGTFVMTPTNNNTKSLIAQLQNGVETVVHTTTHTLREAACGAVFGVLVGSVLKVLPPWQDMVNLPGGLARDCAIWRGTNQGMICALKRIRGKDDTKARAVAGFTSGYLIHVVANHVNPSPRPSEPTVTGLIFALCYSVLHKVFSSQLPVLDDKCYTRTRCMLSKLGLQKYEKHFKKHLLTDNTIPLLNHSDLAEARIPLGPRVLILNHIERDTGFGKMRGS